MGQRIIELNPWGWQHDVLDAIEQYRTTVVLGGRGSGKSLLFQLASTREAFRAPSRKLVYACNSNSLVKEQYQDMKNSPGFSSLLRQPNGCAEVPHAQFRYVNGSRLTLYSVKDVGGKQGLECHFLVMDECRELPESTWKFLEPFASRLRGRVLLLSTPRTPMHWLTRMYDDGQDPKKQREQGIISFKIPSSQGIAYQGEEGKRELARLEATNSRQFFRREYLCEMDANEKGVFAQETIKKCVKGNMKPQEKSTDETVLCWDIARKRDNSVILVGRPNGDLLWSETLKSPDPYEQAKIVKQRADDYNSTVVVESNGTNRDVFIGLMRPLLDPHRLCDVSIRSNNKENLMHQLALRMERAELQIPDDPLFVPMLRELESIEYAETATHVGFKADGHDDHVSCLMLYAEALARNWIGPVVSTWRGHDKPPQKFL